MTNTTQNIKSLNAERPSDYKHIECVQAEDLNVDRYHPERNYRVIKVGANDRKLKSVDEGFVIKDKVLNTYVEQTNERTDTIDELKKAKVFKDWDTCKEELRNLNFHYWIVRRAKYHKVIKAELKSKAEDLQKHISNRDAAQLNWTLADMQELNQMNLNLTYAGLTCIDCNESLTIKENGGLECECSRALDQEGYS